MEVAAKGLLALLIAVTGALNDGLQALQEERFADAIASLTLAVDAQLEDERADIRALAEGLLRERLSDPDPELRLTIREILKP